MVVGFLEDQSVAVSVWRSVAGSPVTLAGVGTNLNLYSEDLEVIDTIQLDQRIVRLVSVSNHTSSFVACADGSLGFIATPGARLGEQLQQAASPAAEQNETAVDADIHKSGHLASVLINSVAGGSVALADTQRDALIGKIPLGQTGTPNAVRFVDNSVIAVGSAVVSLFDIRTPQCKSGVASRLLSTTERGRIMVALDSDGSGALVGGDSSGGVWLWDCRHSTAAVKNVHAHSAAVLSLSLGGGTVGSTSADGSVSLWTVMADQPIRKKSRKLLLDMGDAGQLKRCAVEGSGSATGISVEDSIGPDKQFAYVTDTGVLVRASAADYI